MGSGHGFSAAPQSLHYLVGHAQLQLDSGLAVDGVPAHGPGLGVGVDGGMDDRAVSLGAQRNEDRERHLMLIGQGSGHARTAIQERLGLEPSIRLILNPGFPLDRPAGSTKDGGMPRPSSTAGRAAHVEVGTQALWHGKNPLPCGHMRQHVVGEVRGDLAHTPGVAGGANAAALAGERDQPLVAAALTPGPGEAMG